MYKCVYPSTYGILQINTPQIVSTVYNMEKKTMDLIQTHATFSTVNTNRIEFMDWRSGSDM